MIRKLNKRIARYKRAHRKFKKGDPRRLLLRGPRRLKNLKAKRRYYIQLFRYQKKLGPRRGLRLMRAQHGRRGGCEACPQSRMGQHGDCQRWRCGDVMDYGLHPSLHLNEGGALDRAAQSGDGLPRARNPNPKRENDPFRTRGHLFLDGARNLRCHRSVPKARATSRSVSTGGARCNESRRGHRSRKIPSYDLQKRRPELGGIADFPKIRPWVFFLLVAALGLSQTRCVVARNGLRWYAA